MQYLAASSLTFLMKDALYSRKMRSTFMVIETLRSSQNGHGIGRTTLIFMAVRWFDGVIRMLQMMINPAKNKVANQPGKSVGFCSSD